jgi:hypothetical protein
MSSRGRGELKRIDVLPWLRACGLGALLAGAAFAGGCSTPKLTNPFGGSENTTPSVLADDKLPGATPGAAPSDVSAPANGMSLNCPQVVAWPNERLKTIYQSGHDGDAKFVIHRGELTKLSRECKFYPGRVVVKYGFAGRMLLGPKGKPGRVTMPVKIRVASADKRTLATDKMSISATIPPGATSGYFSMVREISFPIHIGTRPEDYKIFVAIKK